MSNITDDDLKGIKIMSLDLITVKVNLDLPDPGESFFNGQDLLCKSDCDCPENMKCVSYGRNGSFCKEFTLVG